MVAGVGRGVLGKQEALFCCARAAAGLPAPCTHAQPTDRPTAPLRTAHPAGPHLPGAVVRHLAAALGAVQRVRRRVGVEPEVRERAARAEREGRRVLQEDDAVARIDRSCWCGGCSSSCCCCSRRLGGRRRAAERVDAAALPRPRGFVVDEAPRKVKEQRLVVAARGGGRRRRRALAVCSGRRRGPPSSVNAAARRRRRRRPGLRLLRRQCACAAARAAAVVGGGDGGVRRCRCCRCGAAATQRLLRLHGARLLEWWRVIERHWYTLS